MVESVARWVGILVALGCAVLSGFAVPGKTSGSPLLAAVAGGVAVALLIGVARLWSQPNRIPKFLGAAALVFLTFACSAIIAPVLASSRTAHDLSACVNNLKKLGYAAQLYSADWDDRLPIATKWSPALDLYESIGKLKCPLAKTPYSYAMNSGLSSKNLVDLLDPSNTLLFFEADAWGPNASGGSEWLSPRHGNSFVCLADGSVRGVARERRIELKWSP